MTSIDPTARIADGAVIGADTTIGPYCVIGPNSVIGDGCQLSSHVHVAGHTTIGARTLIAPFASLGGPPQSARYRGGPTRLVVGAACDIRENVTLNRGTEDGGGITTVGDRCFFMVGAHVGHDCTVGNDAVFANCATLGGHCVIGDGVTIGGLTPVHQHTRVGDFAMVGGATAVREDVIPFGMVKGNPATLRGLNIIGMRRQQVAKQRISIVRRAYRMLFGPDGEFADRVEAVAAEFREDEVVARILAFIRSSSHRPLCQPARRREV